MTHVPFLQEARSLAGNPRLLVLLVPPQSCFRFGFRDTGTDFKVQSFGGGSASYQVENADGMDWYAVTLTRGMTLCTWQDPFATNHHKLFVVKAVSRVAVAKVGAMFRTDHLIWRTMARVRCPLTVIRKVARRTGLYHAETAIRLARWATEQPIGLRGLQKLADEDKTAQLRTLLDEGFRGFNDREIKDILDGAEIYADIQATP